MLNLDPRSMKFRTASSLTLAILRPPAPAAAGLLEELRPKPGIGVKLFATLLLLAVFAFFSTTASAQLRIGEGEEGEFKASLPNPVKGNTYGAYPSGPHRIYYKYKTVDGDAEDGDDYKGIEGEFLYSAGQQHKYVTVKTYSDNVDQECKEDFYLKLYDKKHQQLQSFISSDPDQSYIAWVDIDRESPPKEFTVKAIIIDRTQSYYNQKYGSCGSSSSSGTYGE